MDTVRLTTRGKVVVGIAIAVAAIAVVGMLLDAATPAECKVAVDAMTDGCKALIYG